MPAAPGLFSTMMGWPKCFEASSASLRRCVSVDPPAGHGQMSVMARVGKSWAVAAAQARPSAASAAAAMAWTRFIHFLRRRLRSLLGLDAGGVDHLRPLHDLLVQKPPGLAGRRADGVDAELLEAL